MKTFRTDIIKRLVNEVALELQDKLGGNFEIFKIEAAKSIERVGMGMDSVPDAVRSMAVAWYTNEKDYFPPEKQHINTFAPPAPVDPLQLLATSSIKQEIVELCLQLPVLLQAVNEPQDIGRQKSQVKREIELLKAKVAMLEIKGRASAETSKNAKVEYRRIKRRCADLRQELNRRT